MMSYEARLEERSTLEVDLGIRTGRSKIIVKKDGGTKIGISSIAITIQMARG